MPKSKTVDSLANCAGMADAKASPMKAKALILSLSLAVTLFENVAGVLWCFGKFFLRPFNDDSQIYIHRFGNPQDGFQ